MNFNDLYPARNGARSATTEHRPQNATISVRVLTLTLLTAVALSACGDVANIFDGSEHGTADQGATNSVSAGTASTGQEQVVAAATSEDSAKTDAPAASDSSRENKPEQTAEGSEASEPSSADSTPAEQTVQTSSNEQSSPAPAESNASGTINDLDTIVNDMALLNDLTLVGVNPAYGFSRGPGYNTMGNNPSGANLPSWYLSSYPEMAQTGYWKSIIPWFVLFEGEGNSATNTRIQMRNMKLFILSRSTNQWTELVSEQDMGGEFCPHGSNYLHCTGGDNKRSESDGGGISIKPMAGNDYHGWYGGRTAINGADIKAVFVTLQSRLLVDSAANGDDRDNARYLFDVGADYYPEMGPSQIYLPGVGVSRAKLITNNWRSFSFTTFSDVGNQDPGGGISEAEFRSNPPPLD
jgi:hypothetical protein